MGNYAHIKRCVELTEGDIAKAAASREGTKALLEHLAARSAPNTGGAKILLVLARIATKAACGWLDGDLRIEIVGDTEVSVLEVMCELGGGMRERVFSPFPLKVPLVEFTRAIERVPHMVAPLAIRNTSATRITLTATERVRKSSVAIAAVKISDESIVRGAPTPPAPAPRKPGPPPLPKTSKKR